MTNTSIIGVGAMVLALMAGSVTAEAAQLLSLNNAAEFNYQTYTYRVVADSSTETLAFSARNNPSYFDLTGLSVSTPTSDNLVTNGNFANGFVGYQLGGNVGFTGTEEGGPNGTIAYLGAVGSDTFLSQVISTNPGTTYNVSFTLQNQGMSDNDFSASFGGALSNVPLPASFPMFGAALVALAAFGYARNRRGVRKAASVA